MMSMKLSNIANLNVNGFDYRCFIREISKTEAVNLLEKADLNEKCRAL